MPIKHIFQLVEMKKVNIVPYVQKEIKILFRCSDFWEYLGNANWK